MLVKTALLRKLSSKQTVNGEKLQESFSENGGVHLKDFCIWALPLAEIF